jgi:hypothetical protein
MIESFSIRVKDPKVPGLVVINENSPVFKVYFLHKGKYRKLDEYTSYDCRTVEESHTEALKFFDRYLNNEALQQAYVKILDGIK